MAVSAIGSQALTSESYAKKIYLDYVYGTNSLGATEDDISVIEKRYSGSLSRWRTQAAVTRDENEYEITDDDHAKNIDKGKAQASEETGFDGEADNTGSKVSAYGTYAVGGVSTVVGGASSIAAGLAALGTKISAVTKVLQFASKYSGYIAAASGAILLGLAVYMNASKLNKEPAEACEQLRDDILPETQGKIAEAEGQVTKAMEDTQEQADTATKANEDADESMAEKKARFDMYITSFLSLQEGARNGTLTKDEADLYNSLIDVLKSVGVDVEQIQKKTEEAVQKAYDNMDALIGQFDDAVEKLGEAQGVVDFARGFDEDTASNAQIVKNSATVGIVGASAAVLSGMLAIGSGKFWEWAPGVAAVGFGTSAGFIFNNVRNHQAEYEQIALDEIIVREGTTDNLTRGLENYNTNIEDYAGYMEDVEGLEMTVPDDTLAPANAAYVSGKDDSSNPFSQNNGKDPNAPGGNGYQAAMGYGSNYTPILQGNKPLDNDGKVIVNNNGKVVLAPVYANAIQKTTGGKPLTEDQIPQVLANLLPAPFTLDNINTVMNGEEYKFQQSQNIIQTLTGKKVGTEESGKASKEATDLMKKVINFYIPIFQKAIAYGWSTNATGAHKEA